MATVESLDIVAKTVLCDKSIKIIVVSAGGKTVDLPKFTDELLLAYEKIKSGESVKKSLLKPFSRVRKLAGDLRLKLNIEDELMKIENGVFNNIAAPDFLLSRGEYLYSKIFAEYCSLPFIDAAELFRFDENGEFNAEFSYYSIKRAYLSDGKFITGGFYGSDENGKIKTFNRGGSDFSGAVAARAICADEYLNFTDVDGVYACNPKIYKENRVISRLSYTTIRRLGEFGASVLHPDSVLPLEKKGIPIIIKNTFNQSAEGTRVSNEKTRSFAVAQSDGFSYVKIFGRTDEKFDLNVVFCKLSPVAITSTGDYFELVCKSENCKAINGGTGVIIENSVTLFFMTDCKSSAELCGKVTGEDLAIFAGKFSDGYYIAVRGIFKNATEKIIADYTAGLPFSTV